MPADDASQNLAQRADNLGREATALRSELHEERLWRRRALLWFIAYVVFSILVLAGMGCVGYVVIDSQHRLIGCTEPGHDCSDRGGKATGDAVASINCTTLLVHGIDVAQCAPTKAALLKLGARLP